MAGVYLRVEDTPLASVRPVPAVGGVSRARVALLFAVLCYAVAFLVAYHVSVVPRYEYFGMGLRDIPMWGMLLLLATAVAPSMLVPVSLDRPSLLLFWAMFLLVYVPSLFLAFYSNRPTLEVGDAVRLAAVLAVSVGVLALGYRVRTRMIRVPRLTSGLVASALIAGAVVLYAVIGWKFGRDFRWVGLADVSSQRELFLSNATGSFGAYAFAWVVAVVNPVLVALGGVARKPILVFTGLGGQVLMYGAAASKGVLLMLALLPILMVLAYRHRERFGAIAALGVALLVAAAPIADAVGLPLVGAGVTFVVLFRTLAIPGLATAQYYEFFSEHPHTLGSHVSGLSSLMEYPYHTTLDYLIGQHYYGDVRMGLNASTWASDGLAGAGLPGMLLVSLLCAVLFWIIDSAAEGLDPRFTIVALAYGVVNFSNVSLFTNVVTGGIALIIVVFALWPRPAGAAVPAGAR